jgi:hypothetical protein
LHDHSGCFELPWDSPQQNDDFLQLLLDKPPVGIHIFSHYDAATGTVPDARGLGSAYDVTVALGGEVQFPPVGSDVAFGTLGHSSRSTTMTVTGAAVGNGVSTVSWSSSWSNERQDYFAGVYVFDNDPDKSDVGGFWEAGYDDNEYPDDGPNYIDLTYRGDWLKFTSPSCFSMTSSQFIERPGDEHSMPKFYKIYARNLKTQKFGVLSIHMMLHQIVLLQLPRSIF